MKSATAYRYFKEYGEKPESKHWTELESYED
jgi:hypothetical protein